MVQFIYISVEAVNCVKLHSKCLISHKTYEKLQHYYYYIIIIIIINIIIIIITYSCHVKLTSGIVVPLYITNINFQYIMMSGSAWISYA